MSEVEPSPAAKSAGSRRAHFQTDLVFPGDSELAGMMRSFDWASTPLGAADRWPRALKTAVGIMLTSRQPIWIGWGRELIYLYNDPYKSIIGGKHPWALGRPASFVWPEIWTKIGPMLAQAMGGRTGTYVESQLLIMERNGYPEETYYTFSYSPIPDDNGIAAGIFCANTDDTERVIGARQLKLLGDLAVGTAEARDWEQVCERGAKALASNNRDLPFAMIYMLERDGQSAVRAGLSGIDASHPAAPLRLMLTSSSSWPLAAVQHGHSSLLVADLAQAYARALPSGDWDRPPEQAVVLPIPSHGEMGRAGFLIVGLNPFRLYDGDYANFLDLAAGQIAAAIANAEAYEQERRRADALLEIDRAKTAFFSNVSHEFRTPLTLLLSPLEDVLAKSESEVLPKNRELVSLAHRNGVRLLKLVNTLLDFSRIEAGRVEASYQKVDLARFTAELASLFESAIQKAGLRLVVRCEALPQAVFVDRDMWEKIIFNLLSNAFKFTFEGEIGVTIKTAADKRHAEVEIRDTGIGISAEDQRHLFERFRRVENARGRSHEGSGIGLALVRELVKLHGGEIGVASEVGRGTTFTVAIPYGAEHHAAERVGGAHRPESTHLRAQAYVDEAMGWLAKDNSTEVSPPSSAEDLTNLVSVAAKSERILLVDDNADMRHYMTRLLETAGFRVEAHADGGAALDAAKRSKPDLVLSDVMMPRLDGLGLLAALREDPTLCNVPVLLLSARAGEEEKVSGLRSGADDYLTKPFSARELIARVQVNLQLAHARRRTEDAFREEAKALEELHRVSVAIAAELDLERVVQSVTDAARKLSGAAFGSFFYNVTDQSGESYLLYALSGAPRKAFETFPMPRNTAVFGPTFRGEGIVRSPDITKDPRFGHNKPHYGMPKGHLPVCSYLAAPVTARSGEVIGGLFFGHPKPGIFTERSERLVASIAVMAAIAVEKVRLYEAAQKEIANRRQIEAVLRQSEQTLEVRVAERTTELAAANEQLRTEAREREKAQAALRQAQKMEGIGQLTGGIAHDFNNLLTVIIGNLESIQRQTGNPQLDYAWLSRSADLAMRGARRAEALTQRLLAFSRQQPLDPKAVDPSRLVTGMSDLLLRTIGEQVTIETVLGSGLWRAHVDPNQLEVAILNLAVNARDAMPQGGKLTIETANVYLDDQDAADQTEVLPGQYAMIAISDNGSGMSREVLARVFEPFFTTKDVGHGTGLGLSQVYGFVKQSRGHVKIYSEMGVGTTVKIYLPRIHREDLPSVEEPVITAVERVGSETMLVVEDDDDVRSYSTETLRELGYDVLEAANGPMALQVLAAHPEVKILFTDVGLPGGMNGRSLAEAARQQRPDLKVLFTTGYARDAIIHEGRLDPGVDLITKPFTQAVLAAKLRDILDARAASRRILVVEDEILLQILLVDCLEEAGFKVDTAASATDAVNKLRLISEGIDAAVVDIGLPDRRGDVLVQELRAIYPALPVIIATGHDIRELRVRFKDQPNMSVIGKPYNSSDLIAALKAVGVSVVQPK